MTRKTTPQRTDLTRNDLMAAQELDYVETFGRLAEVNASIQRRGESRERLLQRSVLYHALGDYVRSARDAGQVVWEDPDDHEAHFRLAAAHLARAGQLRGELPAGLGATQVSREDPVELLFAAWDSLRSVCSANPADEEARFAMAATQRLLTRTRDRGSAVWKTRWELA